MAIDDEAFGRREPKFKIAEIAERITLKKPWEFFDYTNKFELRDKVALI